MSNKKGQGGLAIGLLGFWVIFSLLMTLYAYSDFPAINGLGNINVTTINQAVETEGIADQSGFFGTMWNIISFFLNFVKNFILLITIWVPIFESAIVTIVIGTFFIILKVATWWILIRFWV